MLHLGIRKKVFHETLPKYKVHLDGYFYVLYLEIEPEEE